MKLFAYCAAQKGFLTLNNLYAVACECSDCQKMFTCMNKLAKSVKMRRYSMRLNSLSFGSCLRSLLWLLTCDIHDIPKLHLYNCNHKWEIIMKYQIAIEKTRHNFNNCTNKYILSIYCTRISITV